MDDDWNHNGRTVDGKGNTHIMSSILVSSKSEKVKLISRLPGTGSKNLPGGSLCSVIPYNKPTLRPCPVFDPPVILQEIRPKVSKPLQLAQMKEMLYAIGRCAVFSEDISEAQTFPHWDIPIGNMSP